jgi:3-hydroxyisobutyrate dehydrogenase
MTHAPSTGTSGNGLGREVVPPPRVAVLGIGIMGSGIARNLLRAGLAVDVWDRSPEAAARLTGAGAIAHASPDQTVLRADVAITMLPDGPAVTSVAIDQGMLNALAAGGIWVQMGTIGVQATQQLAAKVADQRPDVWFVDAPVSGTRQPAEAGRLLILASGPEAARLALDPVFGAIGSRTLWLGEAGAGSRLKLVLNSWLAFLMEGIAESVALADILGVSHDAIREALHGSPLDAPASLMKLAKIDAGDESPDFSLRWATKDLELALTEGGERALPVAATIDRRWHELVEAGLGDADVSAAIHGLAQSAGVAR